MPGAAVSRSGITSQHTNCTLANREVEREIPRHAHGLPDLDVGAGPRVRVPEREHHRLTPVAQVMRFDDPPATVTVSV